MTESYRLHYAPDNASLVVRLALEELRQPYHAILVDRAARGQSAPAYLAINPAGLIPALETPDGPLFETGAILLWLADRHGALAPAPDAPDRGAMLKWLFFLANTLHPALRITFYPDRYTGPGPAECARLRSHMQGEIARHLDTVESAATTSPSLFSGTAPTILGLYLGPMLRWMALYPQGATGWFSLARWPHLRAMAAALETRPSIAAAICAEGLGPTPLTAPRPCDPPEGSAL
ncbi:glutathione S-transferase family protein [Roseovarius sp. EGI FJ00037]|uniref:glutathione S-transferase family protein n=1 Tax=Roseovarius TaxID=74030 RepID=UPI0022A7C55E|nr:glutathione S-transferase family protein [Roseovarius sp. EGI FJ00037]MCZ0811170.1 glutathione S-transferase family protein [Roseovarius sp. EGI FJ00037]